MSPALAQTMPPIGYVGPWPPPPSVWPNAATTQTAQAINVPQTQFVVVGPGNIQTQTAPAPLTPPPPTAPARMAATSAPDNAKSTGPAKPGEETLVTAQQMSSNQDTGIVTATGHVEITHGQYILHADKVTYNQNTGVMRAEGHVAMLMPSGEVQFAEAEEVTGDMKQVFAENIGILFPDNSRMASRIAQRYEGRYTVLDKGVYTSCNVCKEDPNNPPLWQMKADQIVHDNVEHDLYYHDVTLEFAGAPVMYTPYFSSADPTVDRRQGFLTPTPGFTPDIGGFVKVPYYFDIAPETDAVVAPTFSQTDKVQMSGEFRHRTENTNTQLDGSFTNANLISTAGVNEGNQWRGHLFGTFLDNISNVWRAGTDVSFTSDKSYLQRYRISSADVLTNRAFVEGFKGRDYAGINSYYFEDLRPGTQIVQPLVLPQGNFNLLGEPGKTFGGRWSLDGSMLVTSRDNANQNIVQQGPDTRRISIDGGWDRRLVSDTGLLTKISGFVRADAYSADNVINPDGSGKNFDNVLLAKQFEQASAVVSYPMGRNGNGYQQMVEPLVSIVGAPNIRTANNQPIEDSTDVQFDETNLFSANRFTGYDLIEGGSRAVYGLRHAITTDSGGRVDMFGGQSYDFSKNANFPGLSGLRDHTSDYVGRIEFVPTKWFNLNYGFRLDHTTFSPQRQDAFLSVGAPIFRPYARYISAYETDATGLTQQVEQATIGADSTIYKYYVIHGEHTQAFSPQPGPRTSAVSLSYIDECFIFGVTASQDETNRADISSGTSVVFHILLRNLGGIKTDTYTGSSFATQFRQNNPLLDSPIPRPSQAE